MNNVLEFFALPPWPTENEKDLVSQQGSDLFNVPVCKCRGPHRPLVCVRKEATSRCYECLHYMPVSHMSNEWEQVTLET